MTRILTHLETFSIFVTDSTVLSGLRRQEAGNRGETALKQIRVAVVAR
jgi:hypothetical protein